MTPIMVAAGCVALAKCQIGATNNAGPAEVKLVGVVKRRPHRRRCRAAPLGSADVLADGPKPMVPLRVACDCTADRHGCRSGRAAQWSGGRTERPCLLPPEPSGLT